MKTSNIDLSFLDTYLDSFENILFMFINNQNLPLCFIYKANNKLTKLLTDYINLIDTLISSINYINNLEKKPKSSTDVQTSILLSKGNATTQLKDKLFSYVSSFQDFKTSSNNEIKESNIDSSENIYAAIAYLEQINIQILELVNNISSFPPKISFEELRLTLLDKLLNIVKQTESASTNQSPISSLINLVSSFSFYENATNTYNVYSPLVSKTIPKDLSIYAIQQKTFAEAMSNAFPQPTTSTLFLMNIDGVAFSIPFPSFLGQGRTYMLGSGTSFNIPPNTRLYFKFNSTPLPHSSFLIPEGFAIDDGYIAIEIPAGVISLTTLIDTLNAGFNEFDTSFVKRQFATAAHFSNGTNRLLIYGNTFVDSFSIIPPPGFYNTATFIYTSANNSCNNEVNLPFGTSKNPLLPDYKDLVDCINYFSPNVSIQENRIRVLSTKQGASASLNFPASISTDIGLSNTNSFAEEVFLQSNGQTVSPTSLGIVTGYKLKDVRGEHIINVSNSITYNDIPNLDKFDVEIYTDLINIVKNILLKVSFTNKHTELINLIRPLVNKPTIEQLNEAKNKLPILKQYYQGVLSSLSFIAVNSPLLELSNKLLAFLEQKGYTKLIDYLNKADFENFFTAVKEKKNLSFNQALADSISNS